MATMALTVGLIASIRSTVAINNSSALSSFLLSARESSWAVEKGPNEVFAPGVIRCPNIFPRCWTLGHGARST